MSSPLTYNEDGSVEIRSGCPFKGCKHRIVVRWRGSKSSKHPPYRKLNVALMKSINLHVGEHLAGSP